MLAFHHPRPRWVASQARIHAFSSGSPKSDGTSRASPAPSGHVKAIAGWPNEPVGTSERKSPGAAARQPLPDDVLPVRRVDDELPDAVAPAARSPRRLFRRYAAERGVKRGAVP